MKKLTCEMCGSTDLVKQDGVFVCQSCGCKYSVEEAKKMMIEGPVEVTGAVSVEGTVKIDNEDAVQKWLENARRAKAKEDWEETEKYYNLVEQSDPNNVEAFFYSAYGKARASLVDGDIYKRQAAFKVLGNCMGVIVEKFDYSNEEQTKRLILQMARDIASMLCSDFVFTEWKNGYGIVVKTNKQETINLFAGLMGHFSLLIKFIAKKSDQTYLHDAMCIIYETALKTGNYNRSFIQKELEKEKSERDTINKKIRQDTYWAEHAAEKNALEQERKGLNSQILNIEAEIDKLPESKKLKEVEEQFDGLVKERDALGVFQFKKIGIINRKIEEIKEIKDMAKKEKDYACEQYQNQMKQIWNRITEIDNELSKDRE